MQTVWKLRVGAEAYYLSQVASGLDEYYTGAGEAPGVWVGNGIESLGLTGEVDPSDLRAVLAGLGPGTGLTPNGATLRSHPRRVPGFDLTFAVPKSVSVAYALADWRVQHLIVTACEAALTETLGWLEREACFVRRGTNKAENRRSWGEAWGTRRTVARGFVGAAYRHRTSRAGDPHLHWHVLVANMAQGVDGRWSALDGRAIYDTARTGGAVFQAAMRRELTAALGVEWGPVHEDAAEIAGIPGRVLREFSQRHEQIAEWLDRNGLAGPAATAEAQRSTRQPKQVPADFDAVEELWRERAQALGWSSVDLEQLLAAAAPAVRSAGWAVEDVCWRNGVRDVVTRIVDFDEWLEWLLDTRVTANNGTFTRLDLTQAVAAGLPATTSLEVVEATVHRALASAAIVSVGDRRAEQTDMHAPCRVIADDRTVRYAARSLLAVERRFVEQVGDGLVADVGVLCPTAIEELVRRSSLGEDQVAAVRALATNGDAVAVLVGRAGSGKTHTLGVVRAAYEAAGYHVVGLAPSARAARELEVGAGIVSTTIARHRTERREINASTVVVVDEAGMAGVRDLAAIVDQGARVGAKIVLVGDHHQLPEVAAGGAFRGALDLVGPRVAELTVNRRQQHEWERVALAQLRDGDVATAFAAYRDRGRVVVADDRECLYASAVTDWEQLQRVGETVMLAGTRAEARLLNRAARSALIAAGALDADTEFEAGGRRYAVGDRVVFLQNHGHQQLASGGEFAVDNGMVGTVVGQAGSGMCVRVAGGEDVIVDREYVSHGWVDHAYAVTIHKVQGVTYDFAIVVGPAGLYREALYVALSRARLAAWIYATGGQLEAIERHDTGLPLPGELTWTVEDELLARMNRSGAKTLVSAANSAIALVDDLATTHSARELVEHARAARGAEAAVEVPNPCELRASYDVAAASRSYLAEGRRVRALDRDNVGTVVIIDDDAGTCDVHFVNDRGAEATRTMPWSNLVVIDHPEPVDLTPEAHATLGRLADAVAHAELDWAIELSAYGVEPGDADRYSRAVHIAVDRAAHALRGEQPDWLTTWLGARPGDPAGASVWDDRTTRIAHFRVRHDIGATVPGLGPCPNESDAAAEWQQLMVATLEDRCWLDERHTAAPTPVPARFPADVHARRDEVCRILASAPSDQRAFIERLTRSEVDSAEVHEQLAAAARDQQDRRAWIVANWPHVVELEQLNRIVVQLPPPARWPTCPAEPVRELVEALRAQAPAVRVREERSLAEISRQQTDDDPTARLKARRDQLTRLAARADASERAALDAATHNLNRQIRAANRQQGIDAVFAKYDSSTTDVVRENRTATVAHDVLTNPPSWVLDGLHRLTIGRPVSDVDVSVLATRIVAAAVELDRSGYHPDHWELRPVSYPVPEAPAPDVPVPAW